MTLVMPPPPGWTILPVEGDPDVLDPHALRYEGPDGQVLTFDEMLEQGLIPSD